MKKYISILIAVLGILGVSSCAKFLDYSSKGSPTEDAFFQTDEQAIDAVKSIYARLPQEGFMGREFYWEQAVASDIVWGKTRSFNTLATFEYTGDEGVITGVFNGCYKEGMNRCNWIIQQLMLKQVNKDLTPVEVRSLGEAYFMRAYWHFLIAYRYGTKDLGVPFVAYETVEGGYNNEIPEQQPSVMVNYQLIVDDLEKAEEILPRFEEYDAANRGRAHKAAAAAVMAKVYAYWATWDKSQWPNVITCVDRLEKTYNRALHPVFTDLFAPDVDKFFTREYCWGYPSNGSNDGKAGGSIEFPGVSLENKGWGKFNGWGQFKPTYDLYEEMAKDNVGDVNHACQKGHAGELIQVAEALQDLRQPLDRHARKAGDAYGAGLQAAQFLRLFLQSSLLFAHRLHPGQQRRAVGCEGHAALAADQQVQPQFFFQGRHRMADPGLRDVQFPRRPGEIAQLGGLQKHFVFHDAHACHLFFQA